MRRSSLSVQLGVWGVAGGNYHGARSIFVNAVAVLVHSFGVDAVGLGSGRRRGLPVGLLVEVVEEVEEDDRVGCQEHESYLGVGAAGLQNQQCVSQHNHELNLQN
jgi:hypothetical protein